MALAIRTLGMCLQVCQLAVMRPDLLTSMLTFIMASPVLLRYAGIGGLSETLGWTEVQQEEGNQQGFISSPWNIIKVVAVFLLFDLLLFGYEQITYMTGQPNIFS